MTKTKTRLLHPVARVDIGEAVNGTPVPLTPPTKPVDPSPEPQEPPPPPEPEDLADQVAGLVADRVIAAVTRMLAIDERLRTLENGVDEMEAVLVSDRRIAGLLGGQHRRASLSLVPTGGDDQ